MEHECFEDPTVAALMNKYFINVKIDREERPDLDQVYMTAIQLLTGSGGWPLNCVALPDGRPLWGGTYFPKGQWIDALSQLAQLHKINPKKAEQYASELTAGIRQSNLIDLNTKPAKFSKALMDQAIRKWRPKMDLIYGGKIGSPKFPIPNNLDFLLRHAVQANDSQLLAYVNTTLTQMAFGGIYDQIGGGFARYSVDDHWHIPHFEKMLYDNAQMVSLYAKAYQVTQNPLYKKIVQETTQFVERELYNEDGIFYSSLDADSRNESGILEEGAFYVWTKKELQEVLGSDFHLFSKYYHINEYGEWEHGHYHLIRASSSQDICQQEEMTMSELSNKIDHWKKKLLIQREKRHRPLLDDKSLCSWNALMLKAYADAYAAFGSPHYLKTAQKNANFIVNHMIKKEGGLYRNYKKGTSKINAYLEDYALLSEAFMRLYEVTLDEIWLAKSAQLVDYCFDHFYDPNTQMFFFTSDQDPKLITRKIDVDDGVIPSSNSVMAHNLFKLGKIYANNSYLEHAATMLNHIKADAASYGSGASNWLRLYSNYLGDYYEVVISGPDSKQKINTLNALFIPNMVIAGSSQQSSIPVLKSKWNQDTTKIYVCVKGTCKLPVTEIKEAAAQIRLLYR